MKIIGMAGNDYIAVVNHTELEKLTDKFYGNMKRLEVGSTMDLGEGHNFRECIKKACREMVEASKAFQQAQDRLIDFSLMVSNLPDETEVQNDMPAR